MLRRDWIVYTALAVAILVASFGVAHRLVSNYQNQQAEQRRDAASYPSERANQNLDDACPRSLGIVERLQCVIGEIKTYRSEKHSEYDLQAQQDMAAWALWMAILTGFSVVVTGAGVVYVALTLREARETTKASVRGADAAERTYLDVERPHLFIEDTKSLAVINSELADVPDAQRPTPEAAYVIKNYGRTPAIITEIRASYRFCVLPEVPHYHPGEIMPSEWVIAPNDTFTPIAMCRGRPDPTNETLNEMMLSEIFIEGRKPFHLYLYGQITYQGVSGIIDQIGFVYRYAPYGNHFHLENIPGYTFRRRGVKPSGDNAGN